MTDPVPSKDQLKLWRLRVERYGGMQLTKPESLAMFDLIERLQRENDTCGLQCSATLKSLVAENERLRTALTGISTCSTCEVCRGAAERALGCEWCQQGIPKSADGRRHESQYGVWACSAQPPDPARRVACETEDGLLSIHRADEDCDVCRGNGG